MALAFLRFIYGQLFHPFSDGNGRSGRSLLNSELIALGLPPLVITMKTRERYLDLLEDISYEFSSEARSYWREFTEIFKDLNQAWRTSIVLTLVLEHSPKAIYGWIDWALQQIRLEGENMLKAQLSTLHSSQS